ncbi:MAG: tRNA (adenosine(37)-N6)-threonylcarbamoyltransferase complex ATPase subunit type 1 TsaE [Bacteroidales bacterium]|mgnify:CR=1 FL=1|nr:tRNA (adenosine(37)-N6)-threonylcarbamoyltransferase complex ATPase subunit type 1 TsaE [Bacteroidales bacterium]
MQEITASENQLQEVAKAILAAYPRERVFGFYGEMGAGKTTLIKEMCNALGVKDITSSPTFAIINEYWTEAGQPLYHFDFYRIDEPADASRVGFEEYLYSGSYCFIEWTEKVEEILQDDFVRVTIERVDDQTRRFIF